jgi:hypothetical protein
MSISKNISEDQNSMTRKLVAKPSETCAGCVFSEGFCGDCTLFGSKTFCTAETRKDGKSIIWVEVGE